MNDKEFKKEIRKTLDSVHRTCKRIPTKDINKILNTLKERLNDLHTEDLESISKDSELLNQRYTECMDFQKKSDKLFVEVRWYQLDLKDINQKLDGFETELTNYMSQIEKLIINDSSDTWCPLKTLIQQNISVITLWKQNNEKLIEQVDNFFTFTVETCKKYVDNIVRYQRLLYR